MAYTVVRGDTLGAIAKANGTTVSELMKLNPDIENADVISIGAEINLPGDPTDGEDGDSGGGEATATGGQELNNVPGRPEVWKVGDKTMLVYVVPGTEDDPVYMSWEVPAGSDMEEFFGPGKEPTYNKITTEAEMENLGVVDFGSTNELSNMTDDPFSGWAAEVEMQAISQPWIMDEDYQTLMVQSILEGQPITDAQIKGTEWYRNNNDAQKYWMELKHGNPAEADRFLEDNERIVKERLTAAGAGAGADLPPEVIEYMAMQYSMGTWSELEMNDQITAITDPASGIEIDADMAAALDLSGIGSTNSEEDTVRSLLNTWLGPAFGDWSEDEIKRIAGEMRANPEYEADFIESLKDQRMAVLPGYENRETSYQAIANTWKQWWMGQWGEAPDETSDLFNTVLQNNDMAESGKLMRAEGLKQGKKKVVDGFSGQSVATSGGSVRGAISG